MNRIFQSRIAVFLGKPLRCSRLEARDKFLAAGGNIDVDITGVVDYVVLFNGYEQVKRYQKALIYERKGRLVFLDEEQFFNILEGKESPPPVKPKCDIDMIDFTYRKRSKAKEAT